MSLRRISIVGPRSELDLHDSTVDPDTAAERLTIRTALWHPAFLAATRELPRTYRLDDLPAPASLAEEMVVIAPSAAEAVPEAWARQVRQRSSEGVILKQRFESRAAFIAETLEEASLEASLDPDLVADFLALAFAYYQQELLTHTMHHSSLLDTTAFVEAVVRAAEACLAGNEQAARDGLQQAFDLLTDSRNQYYPVDSYLIDVTLLAPGTGGSELRSELESNSRFSSTTNVLAAGEVLQGIAERDSSVLSTLAEACKSGHAGVMGGTMRQVRLDRLPPEAMLDELRSGQGAYRELLGLDLEVFAQYVSGWTPLLPAALASLGYRGAMVTSFDGEYRSRIDRTRLQWRGPEGLQLEGLNAQVVDAGSVAMTATLADRVAHSMHLDHVATVVLAGWPGRRCELYEDLRRSTRYSPVLGRFVTLGDYFQETCDDYQVSPWLAERLATSSFVESAGKSSQERLVEVARDYCEATCETHARLAEKLQEMAKRVGIVAPHGQSNLDSSATGRRLGELAMNAWSFSRPMYRDDWTGHHSSVPGFGFAQLAKSAGAAELDAESVPLVEGHRLRNEFLEVLIHSEKGGIQSLRTYRDRRNRASQRIMVEHEGRRQRPARRSGGSGQSESPGSDQADQMQADSISVTRNDAAIGQITSTGRLVAPDGQVCGRFQQQFTLARAVPALLIDIELDGIEFRSSAAEGPQQDQENKRCKSYVASRLAWREDSPSIRHGVQWTAREATNGLIVSGDWVQIETSDGTLELFPMGLPYHVPVGSQMLDTLLMGPGEKRGNYRLAIGLDQPLPTQAALTQLTMAEPWVTKAEGADLPDRGWLMHVDAKNVVATHWEAISEPRPGVRMRVLETEGRPIRAHISAMHPFVAGRQTDFRGEPINQLPVEEGRLAVRIEPFQWVQFDGYWE